MSQEKTINVSLNFNDLNDGFIKEDAIKRLAKLPLKGTTLIKMAELLEHPGAEDAFMSALENPLAKALFKK
jgi:hypothetical protein